MPQNLKLIHGIHMLGSLTEEQRERAEATATTVAAAFTRLELECGEAAVMEAVRLVITASPDAARRERIMRMLLAATPSP